MEQSKQLVQKPDLVSYKNMRGPIIVLYCTTDAIFYTFGVRKIVLVLLEKLWNWKIEKLLFLKVVLVLWSFFNFHLCLTLTFCFSGVQELELLSTFACLSFATGMISFLVLLPSITTIFIQVRLHLRYGSTKFQGLSTKFE